MTLLVEKLTLEPSSSFPLHVLATRYTLGPHDHIASQDDYTLICTHAVGSHKESWEVTVGHLLDAGRKTRHSQFKIREVYSIECPNHGESALVNEEMLRQHYKDSWPTREYTRAIHAFLTAGPSQGARVDFQKRRLVAVGHCLGAVALSYLHEMRPRIHFECFIVLEPGFAPRLDYPDYPEVFRKFQSFVWLRRDAWPSRMAALADLSRNPAYSRWDPAVLGLFVEHAISDHPASKYPPPYTFNGVQISTTKEQETATYRSSEFVTQPLDAFTVTAREMPLYLIWGEVNDILPSHLKHFVTNHVRPASVEYIKEAGHMIVQHKPELIAQKIHNRLILLGPQKAVL